MLFGAAGRIRTADLILTKDALYRLSYGGIYEPCIKRYRVVSALPIFPGGCPPSIFGTFELNYRVRDGNGWTLKVINTDYAVMDMHY